MKQIFLNKNKSKDSSNVDNFINLELSTNERILPIEDINDKVNAYEEYVKEKDESQKYRFICTINPICSNILFNANTEAVYNEGGVGDDVIVVTSGKTAFSNITPISNYCSYAHPTTSANLSQQDIIRDTSYSHPSMGLVYHCGIDIFNNHTLRRKEFAPINKINWEMVGMLNNFNTISDFLRDANGNIIKEKILKLNSSGKLSQTEVQMHLYRMDSLYSYRESLKMNLIESDGWVGFINPTTLNIPNYDDIALNKCMNNNKAGEQYDMYPDRSLYSFIPKYNKFRKRYEKNWDYCITYPYSSDTTNDLVKNGLLCNIIDECDLSQSILGGIDNSKEENITLYLRTQLRNTFKLNDFVTISIYDGNSQSATEEPVKIESIGYLGEDGQHIFAIKLMPFYVAISVFGDNFLINGKLNPKYEIRVKKNVKGIDCQYYIRKFRRLPNFKDSNVYLDGKVTEEEITKNNKKDFNSSLNKMAYEENIYADKVVQIVFNDDIVTKGIVDNLGRELSEVYLTIIKRNRGYEEWYDKELYGDDEVEFSHCFGPVSSGFDLSPNFDNYNVHKIHNINKAEVIASTPAHLEQEIVLENDDFMGDIVEFSPYEVKETTIEEVYHRFNTVQREKQTKFNNGIYYDEIVADDYDIGGEQFNVQTSKLEIANINFNPEGYYYKPHTKILLREYSDNINQGSHTKITYSESKINNNTYYIKTSVPYYLNIGDTLYLYEKFTHRKIIGTVTKVENLQEISFIVNYTTSIDLSKFQIFKPNPIMPSTAYDLNDGTGRYLWREFKSDKDMLPDDKLYNSIFTNGTNYRMEHINFYLRRQDPTGEYGLNGRGVMDILTDASTGKIKDISTAEYIEENAGNIC